jgi:hypothetical protein
LLTSLGNLIFVNDSGLVQWNPIANDYEVLASSISWSSYEGGKSYSISGDGQKIIVEWRKISGEKEVSLFDLGNGTITPLMTYDSILRYRDLTISPDGSWFAFINPRASPSTSSTPQSVGSLISHRYRPVMGGWSSGVIYVGSIESPDRLTEVGFCREERYEGWRNCMGYMWSPDSQSIIWSDSDGVWMSDIGQKPQLLVPHTIGVPPVMTASTVDLRAWSPSGEHVLVGIGHSGGWNWGIINTTSGQVFEFPNWIVRSGGGPSVIWLADERIFALLPGSPSNMTPPSGQIWGIDPIDGSLMFLNEIQLNLSPESYPTAPIQLSENLLGFAILNADESNLIDKGIYFVDTFTWRPTKMNTLPIPGGGLDPTTEGDYFRVTAQFYWSPMGDVVIVEDNYQGKILLLPTDYSVPVGLDYYFGERSCCYTWSNGE